MIEKIQQLSAGELPVLAKLISSLGLDAYFQGGVSLRGCDPVLQSPHRLGEAVSSVLALDAVAAASIWQFRSGHKNDLSLDIQDAIHYLHPVHFVWQNGYNINLGAESVPANGFFKCKDGRHVWIQCGPPYPKLQNGYLNFFNCGNNREAIGKVILQWNSLELEEKLSEIGLPCCQVRSCEEWQDHPQGKILAKTPVIEIEKIADSKPYGLTATHQSPLAGVKVVDFTHVLAGPRSTMTLAEFGADVLHVASPFHLDPLAINLGVNHGKRSAYLNLQEVTDREKMQTLLMKSDVFAQSYRPGVMAKFGLTAEEVIRQNPNGLVYLSINAYGHSGHWKDRPGFDQNAQMTSGFSVTEGSLEQPKTSPVFYINDLLTAYLAAAGVMTALLRRAVEGGSYHVKVSLTRSAMWTQELSYVDKELFIMAPPTDNYPLNLVTNETHYGSITRLAPAVKWSNPFPSIKIPSVVPYGTHTANFS